MRPQEWIDEDESAKEMFERVLTERPFLLLPPLHRVPLRVGNVVEIVGPSPSAKTHILIQAAINCILPKEWNGVNYGGLGRLVLFLDLDCRFDVLRFSELLKRRISEGSSGTLHEEEKDVARMMSFNEDLFALCMKRFLYIRCYDSFEFLATLKTLHYQIQKVRAAHGGDVHFLVIDSIGAFHWVDRASSSFPLDGTNRKNLSLQNVSEIVVQEIRKVLMVNPMLVIATKATILGDRYTANEMKGNFRKLASSNTQQIPYREYMPSVWQSFVTHRILIRTTDDGAINNEHQNASIYLSEWLLPPLSSSDKFVVKDAGLFVIS